jgi:hypothetical protein
MRVSFGRLRTSALRRFTEPTGLSLTISRALLITWIAEVPFAGMKLNLYLRDSRAFGFATLRTLFTL